MPSEHVAQALATAAAKAERTQLAIHFSSLTCMRRTGETAATLRKRDADLERLGARIAELDKQIGA